MRSKTGVTNDRGTNSYSKNEKIEKTKELQTCNLPDHNVQTNYISHKQSSTKVYWWQKSDA